MAKMLKGENDDDSDDEFEDGGEGGIDLFAPIGGLGEDDEDDEDEEEGDLDAGGKFIVDFAASPGNCRLLTLLPIFECYRCHVQGLFRSSSSTYQKIETHTFEIRQTCSFGRTVLLGNDDSDREADKEGRTILRVCQSQDNSFTTRHQDGAQEGKREIYD